MSKGTSMNHSSIRISISNIDDSQAILHLRLQSGTMIVLCVVMAFLIPALICSTVKPTATIIQRYSANYSSAQIGTVHLICKDNGPYENELYISILRVIQLRMEASVLIRTAILLPLSGVVFAVYCRRSKFLLCNSLYGPFCEMLANISPITMALHLILLNLIFMRNIFIDNYVNGHTVNLFFAYVSIANMIIYTAFDICDKSSEMIQTKRFKIRLICVVINLSLYTTVFQNFFIYTQKPLCHSFVPSSSAFAEYFYICSHLIFYSTMLFDFDDIDVIIFADINTEVGEKFLTEYHANMPIVDSLIANVHSTLYSDNAQRKVDVYIKRDLLDLNINIQAN